mmetsp:Transcript_40166/g.102827  ORF Transcript_40166/g.102827 Transcript_40166/m.102827 type:complete len:222 (+) Transcript_40166:447-1112(+)
MGHGPLAAPLLLLPHAHHIGDGPLQLVMQWSPTQAYGPPMLWRPQQPSLDAVDQLFGSAPQVIGVVEKYIRKRVAVVALVLLRLELAVAHLQLLCPSQTQDGQQEVEHDEDEQRWQQEQQEVRHDRLHQRQVYLLALGQLVDTAQVAGHHEPEHGPHGVLHAGDTSKVAAQPDVARKGRQHHEDGHEHKKVAQVRARGDDGGADALNGGVHRRQLQPVKEQ